VTGRASKIEERLLRNDDLAAAVWETRVKELIFKNDALIAAGFSEIAATNTPNFTATSSSIFCLEIAGIILSVPFSAAQFLSRSLAR
jgi:hypothetical protein